LNDDHSVINKILLTILRGENMKHKGLFTFMALALLVSMVLGACTTAATPTVVETEAPPAETQAPPAATEAPQETMAPEATEAVEPTAAATEEAMGPHELWTPTLKQAFAAAIDREAIVDRVFEGRNTPAYHMVPPGYPYATEPFLDKYGTRDLQLAIDLLEQAGYTEENPFEFDLWYPPEHYGTTTADVMQIIKEQLEETGRMQVNLQTQNWAEYVDSFVAGEAFPVFILGWFPDFADPDNWLTPFASCEQSPDNGVFFCDEQMDQLLQSAAAESDDATRADLYQQIGDLYAELVPTLPLFWEPEFVTYRDGVEGVTIGAPFEFNYNVVSFGDGASPAAGSTDTIIIGTTDEVNSLDPQDAYATHDWEILKNTGAPLLQYEAGTSNLVPGAAAAMPEVSDDGLTYTFTLRDGLQYADGTPVTAQDYVRMFERIEGIGGQVSGLVTVYVDSVEAIDDSTVAYHLTDSYGFFPALAATAPFIPSNPNIFPDDEIVQFPDQIDGIGPYRMVSHTPGEQMVLEANPNYFGEQPNIPNVIIRYFADPTTMSNAVETGEIDVAWRTLGPVEAVRLMDVSGLTVDTVDAPALRYLVFNHNYVVGGGE
jgi:peptide/nickel transport system substrate-binding protein